MELVASNKVQSIRSNCIITAWFWQRPPLELAYQNCIDLGYSVINILSVNRVGGRTAKWMKDYINRQPPKVSSSKSELESSLDKLMRGVTDEGGS